MDWTPDPGERWRSLPSPAFAESPRLASVAPELAWTLWGGHLPAPKTCRQTAPSVTLVKRPVPGVGIELQKLLS